MMIRIDGYEIDQDLVDEILFLMGLDDDEVEDGLDLSVEALGQLLQSVRWDRKDGIEDSYFEMDSERRHYQRLMAIYNKSVA